MKWQGRKKSTNIEDRRVKPSRVNQSNSTEGVDVYPKKRNKVMASWDKQQGPNKPRTVTAAERKKTSGISRMEHPPGRRRNDKSR